MPDFLSAPFVDGPPVAPLDVLIRMLVSLVMGCVVAVIYRFARRGAITSASFPATLVLLAVLIAMVTQVIGDNIARAFSLVGALSIVRFRTVVRDTQDTAYVIFAVVVGMAVGAKNLWVGGIGLGVVGLAALLLMLRSGSFAASQPAYLLTLRVGIGHDVNTLLGGILDAELRERELVSVTTARQGVALEVTYETRLRPDCSADELVKALNRIEGVQSVQHSSGRNRPTAARVARAGRVVEASPEALAAAAATWRRPSRAPRLSPADVTSYTNAPLYDPLTLRTLFIEFEDADWEKELAEFSNSDVEVPATLTVDGKTYPDVGVHFRGASSLMMVPEGRKRSLNVSMDVVHDDQNLGGYRTLNLLNSHEDPSFLRPVLFNQIAREYLPAPRANFVRVVINGECWGVYVSTEQFNRDFIQERFGTTQGARWKVPGRPGGRGGLEYLGEDAGSYKRTYEIRTKDDPKAWTDLIRLCRILNTTPADRLEKALAPLLDIDGALKFLALENTLINNDGYWIRASDYSLYQDVKGRFHVFPHDANETFSLPGGPGFGGGPGGRGGFGPGMFLAPQLLSQADKNDDQQLTKAEFTALADSWYDKLDPDRTDGRNQDEFVAVIGELLPPPQGFGPPGGGGSGGPRPGGAGPAMFIAPVLFSAADANTNGLLTRAELKALFGKWFTDWDTGKSGSLGEETLRAGVSAALPRPRVGQPGGGRGPGGPGGGGLRVNGVELDPLVATNDTAKPLLSKLLAVPALRARYLATVREIAGTWLDWNKLGPIAEAYHALIADAVRADTRKLDSIEAFQNSLTGEMREGNSPRPGPPRINLKSFAEKRRAYLLKQTAPSRS